MTAQPFIIFSYLIGIILIVAVFIYNFSLRRKNKQLDDELKNSPTQSEMEVFRRGALEVVQEVENKAKNILLDTEYVKQDLIRDLDTNLQKISADSLKQLEVETLEYNKQFRLLFDSVTKEQTSLLQEIKTSVDEVKGLKDKLLKDYQDSIKQISSDIAKMVQVESEDYDKQFKQTLDNVQKAYLEHAQTSIQKLEQIPEQELTAYKEILRKETVESQEIIGKRINKEFEDSQEEIHEFKDAKIKEIAEHVQEIVENVAQNVLNKSLSYKDQEQLILQALQEAKADGVFGKNGNVQKSK